jgi:FixJ family two-component response regulator
MAYCVVGDSRAIQEAMGKLMESKDLQKVILDSGREFLQSPRYLEMVNTQALRNLANMIVTDLLCREESGE